MSQRRAQGQRRRW